MEFKEEHAIVSLLDKDPELKKFYEEHREFEKKLAEFQHKHYLTPDDGNPRTTSSNGRGSLGAR